MKFIDSQIKEVKDILNNCGICWIYINNKFGYLTRYDWLCDECKLKVSKLDENILKGDL